MQDTELKKQQPENTAPVEADGQGERLFTQDDVNRIVSDRLKRSPAFKQANAELEAREKAVSDREAAAKCRKYIMDQGYPEALMDTLDTADPDAFIKQADSLYDAFRQQFNRSHEAPPLRVYSEEDVTGRKSVRAQFTSVQKHTPTPWPPRPKYDWDYK